MLRSPRPSRARRRGAQRWHISAALAGAALLAALLVPDIGGARVGIPTVAPAPVTTVVQAPAVVAPVAAAGPVRLHASLDQTALLQGQGDDRFLVIELEVPEDPDQPRQPVHVAVVMDTSGSMAGRGKITHARQAAQELVGMLGPHDSFSLVTFDDRAEVVVPAGPVADKAALHRRIGSIRTGGGTNLYDGLVEGQAQLQQGGLEGVRRVVLLSDGKANIGVSDDASLRRQAGALVREGISVSAMGLGLEYNEDLLAAMSDAGGGRYRFVDRPGELAEVFSDELQRIGKVVAREASVALTLPPGVVVEEIYGYEAALGARGGEVFLGDLHAGERRKLVARVRVDTQGAGTVDVAGVALGYTDAATGAPGHAEAAVQARITADQRVARASVDRKARKQAVRVQAAKLVDEGARAWDAGDMATNQASYQEAERLLRAYTDEFDDAELEASAEKVEAQRGAFGRARPASAAGAVEVKRAKEAARADSLY